MRVVAAPLTRRAAAAAILSLTPLVYRAPASAILGIGEGPQGEFRQIFQARFNLDDLAKKLETKELRGSAEDSVVVLQTLTIQMGGTLKLLEKTTEEMPLLTSAEAQAANDKSAVVKQAFEVIRQGCRDKAADKQLEGAKAASTALGDYLAVAAGKYTLPKVERPAQMSQEEFIAAYYGIFSCEGQGLERVKGSNACKDTKDNKNPFPTKQFLDFDFLTGEKLPVKK